MIGGKLCMKFSKITLVYLSIGVLVFVTIIFRVVSSQIAKINPFAKKDSISYIEKTENKPNTQINTNFPTPTVTATNPGNPQQTYAVNLQISDDDPSLGSKNAKVIVVSFQDFQCPFCSAFDGFNSDKTKSLQEKDPNWQPTLINLKKDYIENGAIRYIWKDYPFLGNESFWSAQAAHCAQDQNKFWEYHDYLFSHQNGQNQGTFSKDNLKKFATNLSLNTNDFNKCLDSGKYENKIQDAVSYSKILGVNGTPATYINGKAINGAVSYLAIKNMIDKELSDSRLK